MRSALFISAIALVALIPSAIRAEEPKADPQASLESALPELIRLLEAKEYTQLLKTWLAPDDLARLEKEPGLDVVAKGLGGEKADRLHKVLKEAKKMQPRLSEGGELATYVFPNMEFPDLRFQKVGKRWYIKN